MLFLFSAGKKAAKCVYVCVCGEYRNMADKNPHQQEWSFEAQWTWTTGGDGGPAGNGGRQQVLVVEGDGRDSKSTSDVGPSVTRIFRDGSSEIQMEYSWQPPSTSGSQPRGSHSQPRPKSFHAAEDSSGFGKRDAAARHRITTARPQTLETATSPGRPRGTNGRWSSSSHMGDSGYGSSELSSPQHKAAPVSRAVAPSNGRSSSSCNIILERNSAWSEPRAQPVFHGPNCECIVCHDMQVRFESTPNPQRYKLATPAELQERGSRPREVAAASSERKAPPPQPAADVDAAAATSPQMYRSHFCTHVPGKRTVTFTPSGDRAPPPRTCQPEQSIRLEPTDDAYLHILQKLPQIPSPSSWERDQPSVSWRSESRGGSATSPGIQRRDRKEPLGPEDRRHYRYSYPSSLPAAKPKPRIIHIDVYCTEDDNEDEDEESRDRIGVRVATPATTGDRLFRDETTKGGSAGKPHCGMSMEIPPLHGQTVQKPFGDPESRATNAPVSADASTPSATRAFADYGGPRSERLHKTAIFGTSLATARKAGHHVGPARNKNCSCDSCRRYFGALTTPSSSVSLSDVGGDTKPFQPGDHVGKP